MNWRDDPRLYVIEILVVSLHLPVILLLMVAWFSLPLTMLLLLITTVPAWALELRVKRAVAAIDTGTMDVGKWVFLSKERIAVVSDRRLREALRAAGWPTESIIWFRRVTLAISIAVFMVLLF